MNSMQGKLWKWTNYMSGWQPRWFVLESGVLSYYISQEEVTQGSRRSYKAASCDVNVDKNDELHMHIITPDNGYIYLKAANKVDRQKWVVALASAKLEDTAVDKPVQQETIRGGRASKTKGTELRETCNHLLTQVRSIKIASTQSPPDVKSMEALASTLTITCDDFLRLVQECMDHAHNHSAPVTPVGLGGTINFLSVSAPTKRSSLSSDDEARSHNTPSQSHTTSTIHNSLTPTRPPTKDNNTLTASLPAHLTASQESPDKHVRFDKSDTESTPSKESKEQPTDKKTHSRSNSDVFITPTGTPNHSPPPSPGPHSPTPTPSQANTVRERALANQNQRPMFEHVTIKASITDEQRKFETFFSRATPSFGDLVLQEKDGIPSKEFLECARVLLPFFDALSPTAFAPVKADVGGNIEKASNKFAQDPTQYSTLQVIVEQELATDTAGAGSGTEGLLWLKRGMEFIYLFLGEVARGEQALDVAAGKAYSKSLRRHHNWMVRGIFSLAMKAVPYYADFLAILGSDGSEESEKQVTNDMTVFAQNLGEICIILDQFLIEKNLETEH